MSSEPLRERAYRHIQAKIFSGDYAPGTKVSEQAIAAEIGISRTPVRSAVHQLESEGLLEQVPRFGTIVKKLERRDIEEIYDMRIALEGFAAEAAGKGMLAEDVEQLESTCKQAEELIEQVGRADPNGDPERVTAFFECDRRFHLIILRATGNRRMMKAVTDSRMLSQWCYFARSHYDIDRLTTAWRQHRQILAAIRSGDPFQSWQTMYDHIHGAKEEALCLFDREQAIGDARELLEWSGTGLP